MLSTMLWLFLILAVDVHHALGYIFQTNACEDHRTPFRVELQTNYYADRTNWKVIDIVTRNEVLSSSPYSDKYYLHEEDHCLDPDKCYQFIIEHLNSLVADPYYGREDGFYRIVYDGILIGEGSKFENDKDEESIYFGDSCDSTPPSYVPSYPPSTSITPTESSVPTASQMPSNAPLSDIPSMMPSYFPYVSSKRSQNPSKSLQPSIASLSSSRNIQLLYPCNEFYDDKFLDINPLLSNLRLGTFTDSNGDLLPDYCKISDVDHRSYVCQVPDIYSETANDCKNINGTTYKVKDTVYCPDGIKWEFDGPLLCLPGGCYLDLILNQMNGFGLQINLLDDGYTCSESFSPSSMLSLSPSDAPSSIPSYPSSKTGSKLMVIIPVTISSVLLICIICYVIRYILRQKMISTSKSSTGYVELTQINNNHKSLETGLSHDTNMHTDNNIDYEVNIDNNARQNSSTFCENDQLTIPFDILPKYKFFISYVQKEASTAVMMLKTEMEKCGHKCWMDLYAKDKSSKGMENGVRKCDVVLLILTESYLSRDACVFELAWAMKYQKKVQPLHLPSDKSKIGIWRCAVPKAFTWIFDINVFPVEVTDARLLQVSLPILVKDAISVSTCPPLPDGCDAKEFVRQTSRHQNMLVK